MQTPSGHNCDNVGPLVDDGAPYSAIGEMELHIFDKELIYEPKIAEKLQHYPSTKLGSMERVLASVAKKSIIGSVQLFVQTDNV